MFTGPRVDKNVIAMVNSCSKERDTRALFHVRSADPSGGRWVVAHLNGRLVPQRPFRQRCLSLRYAARTRSPDRDLGQDTSRGRRNRSFLIDSATGDRRGLTEVRRVAPPALRGPRDDSVVPVWDTSQNHP